MPREGQTTVTLPTYSWERAVKYFKKHKRQLKRKGIHSTSKLIDYWIEERCAQEQFGIPDSSVALSGKVDVDSSGEQKKE